jgi:hypothetical protein
MESKQLTDVTQEEVLRRIAAVGPELVHERVLRYLGEEYGEFPQHWWIRTNPTLAGPSKMFLAFEDTKGEHLVPMPAALLEPAGGMPALKITETVSSSGIDIVRVIAVEDLGERFSVISSDPTEAAAQVRKILCDDDFDTDLHNDLTEWIDNAFGEGHCLYYEERHSEDINWKLIGAGDYVPEWKVEVA